MTGIDQRGEEIRAIQLGLRRMEQRRSAEHRTTCGLLAAVMETQGRPENRLGFIEIDSSSQLEPTMRRSKTSTIAFPSIKQQGREHATRRLWKTVHWKWSMYRFPIGVLSIDYFHETASGPSNAESYPEDRILVTFVFSPPKWIWNALVKVSYAISAESHLLPFWQRTQSGALSILPPGLADHLEDGDFMAVGDLLSGLSFHEICELESPMNRFKDYASTSRGGPNYCILRSHHYDLIELDLEINRTGMSPPLKLVSFLRNSEWLQASELCANSNNNCCTE